MKTSMVSRFVDNRNGFGGTFAMFAAAFFVGTLQQYSLVVQALEFTEMYIPYNTNSETGSLSFGDFGPYAFDDPLRQHLHLFQLSSNSQKPSPVLLWAHSNGSEASDLGPSSIQKIASASFSILSWESASKVSGPEDVQACLSDFEVVWSWYQEHAEEYNLDPNYAIVGGRSRGSICSWQMAHSAKPEIRGIYMYNALPDSVWRNGAGDVLVDMVTLQSPPAFLGYGPECPKPIQQDCVPSPNPNDGHSPRNGQTIVDRYGDLGMEASIQLFDGFHNKGIGLFDDFADFTRSIESPNNSNNSNDGIVDPPPPSLSNLSCSAELMLLCPPTLSSTPKSCGECVQANNIDLMNAGCTIPMTSTYCQNEGATTNGAATGEEEPNDEPPAVLDDAMENGSEAGAAGSKSSAFASSAVFDNGRNCSVWFQMMGAIASLVSVLLLQ